MFRDAVMATLRAEGAQIGVWQNFILPAMTVFQAKTLTARAVPGVAPIPSLLNITLRIPCRDSSHGNSFRHDLSIARLTVKVRESHCKGFSKVFNNLDKLDVEKSWRQRNNRKLIMKLSLMSYTFGPDGWFKATRKGLEKHVRGRA